VLHLVGDGVPAHRDGGFAEARFEAPRGVCWRGEELLVADTGNDAIRSADLATGEVTTLVEAFESSLPSGIAQDTEGEIAVALPGEGRVARLADGELRGLADEAGAGHPVDVVADGDGWLLADLEDARVQRIGSQGLEAVWKGSPLVEPTGLHRGADVTVADPGLGIAVELAGEGQAREVLGANAGPSAPSAVDREADQLVVADGGGHHLWRMSPEGDEAPARIRLTESPLSLAEHIRLDPIEMAPGGRLELSISYMLRDGDPPASVQGPTARGPVRGLASGEGPMREEGRIRVEMAGEVAASGNLRLRWSLTEEAIGHEAAWDLPIVVRPGAERRLRLALSTSPP
jgi:hypothetical protein